MKTSIFNSYVSVIPQALIYDDIWLGPAGCNVFYVVLKCLNPETLQTQFSKLRKHFIFLVQA